jgi:hypothetical protein
MLNQIDITTFQIVVNHLASSFSVIMIEQTLAAKHAHQTYSTLSNVHSVSHWIKVRFIREQSEVKFTKLLK